MNHVHHENPDDQNSDRANRWIDVPAQRLFLAVLLMPSLYSWASDFGGSKDVYLTGGVCNDDTFSIVQKVPHRADPENVAYFTFTDHCKTLSIDTTQYDMPPATFICHRDGKTKLSGATYKKVKNVIIKSTDEMQADTRVYVYKCVSACAHAPKQITYKVEDCG